MNEMPHCLRNLHNVKNITMDQAVEFREAPSNKSGGRSDAFMGKGEPEDEDQGLGNM